jgi:predicted RNA-binding protein with PIN domain
VRHIIVDGYNVIRCDPRLQSLERVSLERARDVLVQTLASSPRLANDQIIVVFDGRQGAREHVHTHKLGRIVIMYSARGQTADDVIVSQARSLSAHGRVVVVSNDVEVRENCRAAGCEISGSENLLTQLPGGRRPVNAVIDEDEDVETSLATTKHGNPRRASKKARRHHDVRF